MNDKAVELGEIVATNSDEIGEAINSHPDVRNVTALESAQDRVLGKYETVDTKFYDFFMDSEVPMEFPVVVKNGSIEFELTGKRREVTSLRNELEESSYEYRIISMVETHPDEKLLTDRQSEMLMAAVRGGYYDVPRESSQRDLAEELDVDNSTVSDVLRRAESTLIEWYFERAG